jgi:ribosomal-protein-serine acetyltransferase
VRIPVTETIELALLDVSDAEALFQAVDRNRAHLEPWLPWVDGTRDVEDSRTFIETARKRSAERRGWVFGIWLDGRLTGTIGLECSEDLAEGEIGYWIDETEQGKGIVTRATESLLVFAFSELGLARVVINCAVTNARSRHVPERLGFRFIGERPGAEVRGMDQIRYGLSSSEWSGSRGRVFGA